MSAILLGLLLGALGALGHLAVVAWRARVALSGRPGLSLLALPLGLLLPALAALGAARLSPAALAAAVAGILLARTAVLSGWKGAPA